MDVLMAHENKDYNVYASGRNEERADVYKRQVQLVRNGKNIATIDVYQFIMKGHIQDEDVYKRQSFM